MKYTQIYRLTVALLFLALANGACSAPAPLTVACLSERCATPDEPAAPNLHSEKSTEVGSSGGGRSPGCPKTMTVNARKSSQGRPLASACDSDRCATPEGERMKRTAEIQVACMNDACATNESEKDRVRGKDIQVACADDRCATTDDGTTTRSLNRAKGACVGERCVTEESEQQKLLRGKDIQIACLNDKACFIPDDEARTGSGFGFAPAAQTAKTAPDEVRATRSAVACGSDNCAAPSEERATPRNKTEVACLNDSNCATDDEGMSARFGFAPASAARQTRPRNQLHGSKHVQMACGTEACAAPDEKTDNFKNKIQFACQTESCATDEALKDRALRGKDVQVACISSGNCAAPDDPRTKFDRMQVACNTENCATNDPEKDPLALPMTAPKDQESGGKDVQIACASKRCATEEPEQQRVSSGKNVQIACISEKTCLAPDEKSNVGSAFSFASGSPDSKTVPNEGVIRGKDVQVACPNSDTCATTEPGNEQALRGKDTQIACIRDTNCFAPDEESKVGPELGFATVATIPKSAPKDRQPHGKDVQECVSDRGCATEEPDQQEVSSRRNIQMACVSDKDCNFTPVDESKIGFGFTPSSARARKAASPSMDDCNR